MDINELNLTDFQDIFNIAPAGDPSKVPFTGQGAGDNEVNLFETTIAVTGETTTVETTNKDADILTVPEKKVEPKIADVSGFAKERFESGKFVKIVTQNDKGEDVDFIPSTFEELDEVIDIQINKQLETKGKELESNWYASKTPAWKAVAQYAELVDNPVDILPFIQGVRTIQSVSGIDETKVEGAEAIVRARLEQQGEDPEVIEDQIESLKTTDKLISTAQRVKPLIVQGEQQRLQQLKRDAEIEDQKYYQSVHEIREKVVQSIEAPIFGKQKLKQDEKAIVYDLIAVPQEEHQGYKIYTVLDSLFEKRDFATLTKVALLLGKEASFTNYLTANSKEQVSESLQKKLRAATEGKGGNTQPQDEIPAIQRKQYSGKLTFGG